MKKLLYLFIFLVLFIPNVKAYDVNDIKLYSDNAILYNVEEDKVMFEKKSTKKIYIASLTKVLTAFVVLDKVSDLDKKIDFSKVDYDYLRRMDLQNSTLNRNGTYTYRDFLYSLVMESSADCGYALALDVGGSVKGFSKLMNEKAKELGMNSSHFSNPVGLDEGTHYSTMNDMLKLMKSSLKNEPLKKIMSTWTYKVSDGKTIKHTMYKTVNRNDLDMPYLKGGKTGYNDIPGQALMSYANQNGSTYIFITTNAKFDGKTAKHFVDAKKIYDYYFNNYGYQTVIKKGDLLVSLDTHNLKEDKIDIRSLKAIKFYLRNDYDFNDIVFNYKGVRVVNSTYSVGDKLGEVSVYYKNNFISNIDVFLDSPVTRKFNIVLFLIFLIFPLAVIILIVEFIRRGRKKKEVL